MRHGARWAPSAASLAGRGLACFTSCRTDWTRTFPPGHVFNWHDPSLRRVLDVEASTLPLSYANASGMATVNSSLTMQEPIGIEALPPDEALPPPADASAQWARAATRRLRDENRPPEDAKKKQS